MDSSRYWNKLKRQTFAAIYPKRIFWSNLLCLKNVRTNSPASTWRLIIDRFILENIQSCTIPEAQRQARCKDFTLTVEELEAFISIMYVHGVTGKNDVLLTDLWNKD